jgi:hypothetical protein
MREGRKKRRKRADAMEESEQHNPQEIINKYEAIYDEN